VGAGVGYGAHLPTLRAAHEHGDAVHLYPRIAPSCTSLSSKTALNSLMVFLLRDGLRTLPLRLSSMVRDVLLDQLG
jgi:hypothetical protein